MAAGPIYLPTSSTPPVPAKRSKWPLAIAASLLAALVLYTSPASVSLLQVPELLKHSHKHGQKHEDSLKNACLQAEPSMPKGYNVSRIWEEKDRIVDWLVEAVKIPTEIFDEMGPVDEDPQWRRIGTFQDYLEKSFPKM